MSEWNKRVEDKIDTALRDITTIKIAQAEHNVQVQSYMERTGTLETKLAPIQTHVDRMGGAVKLVTLLGVLAGIVEVVLLCIKR